MNTQIRLIVTVLIMASLLLAACNGGSLSVDGSLGLGGESGDGSGGLSQNGLLVVLLIILLVVALVGILR